MPQIIIKKRSKISATSIQVAEQVESPILVIIEPDQIEIYTDEDAQSKLTGE